MYNNLPIGLVLIYLLLPITVLVILVVKSSHVWQRHLAGKTWWVKAAAVGCLGIAVLWGGDKGPVVIIPQALVEILTVRPDGVLGDLSGRVVPGVQAKAVADYIQASASLVDAADDIIELARLECIALTNQLLQADYDIAYLALDLPRGTTTQTNHNIMVTFQRVEQSAETLDALVWFSEMPSTNVNVYAEYSIRDGVWSTLSPVTNYWPATEIVDGVECVRYRYAIPSAINGTPLKPEYEVTFGGPQPIQYLSVPDSGVVVSVGEVDHLPFTGWDDYSEGTNSVLVHFVGGIAVEAIVDGVKIKGGSSI